MTNTGSPAPRGWLEVLEEAEAEAEAEAGLTVSGEVSGFLTVWQGSKPRRPLRLSARRPYIVDPYTRRALRQIDSLIQHYKDRERYEAIRTFRAALDEAEAAIERDPAMDCRHRVPIHLSAGPAGRG